MLRWFLLVLLLTSTGCGESNSNTDAGSAPALDAGSEIPDSSTDPCPGQTTLELAIEDWETEQGLFDVEVTVESASVVATSAPNGRVLLCLDSADPISIRLTHPDYLPHLHTTTLESVNAQREVGLPSRLRMLSQMTTDALYTGQEQPRLQERTTFFATVTPRTDNAMGASATVTLGAPHDGAFATDAPTTTLTPGNTTAAPGHVVFLNTDLGMGTTPVSVSPGTCSAPSSVPIAAGVSSVAILCGS